MAHDPAAAATAAVQGRPGDPHPVDEVQTPGFWRIGARLPIVQGTSFAAVASMLAVGKAGPRTGPSRAE